MSDCNRCGAEQVVTTRLVVLGSIMSIHLCAGCRECAANEDAAARERGAGRPERPVT